MPRTPYVEAVFQEFKSLARKFGDPGRLTRAKFRRIRRVCRNAAFAGSGEWQKLRG